MIKNVIRRLFGGMFRERTLVMVYFDLLRLRTRMRARLKKKRPISPKLHLACGDRRIPGWLNVDAAGSEFDVDLGAGRLPWGDASFDCVVSQHLIDDLEIESELIPLFREIKRVLKPGGELWLSTPDMEKICRSYLEDGGTKLIADRRSRMPGFNMKGYPDSQYMNVIFFEWGRNQNLFDFPLLNFVLRRAGFEDGRRASERDLLKRFPDFPPRRDDYQSLYVCAAKTDKGGPGV